MEIIEEVGLSARTQMTFPYKDVSITIYYIVVSPANSFLMLITAQRFSGR